MAAHRRRDPAARPIPDPGSTALRGAVARLLPVLSRAVDGAVLLPDGGIPVGRLPRGMPDRAEAAASGTGVLGLRGIGRAEELPRPLRASPTCVDAGSVRSSCARESWPCVRALLHRATRGPEAVPAPQLPPAPPGIHGGTLGASAFVRALGLDSPGIDRGGATRLSALRRLHGERAGLRDDPRGPGIGPLGHPPSRSRAPRSTCCWRVWTLAFFLIFKDVWEYHYVMLLPVVTALGLARVPGGPLDGPASRAADAVHPLLRIRMRQEACPREQTSCTTRRRRSRPPCCSCGRCGRRLRLRRLLRLLRLGRRLAVVPSSRS